MNIHLPAILGFTRYQGFDPSPNDDTRPLYFSIGQGSPAALVPRRFSQCRMRRHAAPGLHQSGAPSAARAEAAAGHGLERLGEAKFLGVWTVYIYIYVYTCIDILLDMNIDVSNSL